MPESGSHCWAHPSVILVATDLSDLERLMPVALEQAEESGSRLILVHVIAATAAFSADAAGLPYYNTGGPVDYAEKKLAHWCEVAGRLQVRCDGLVREGNATHEILDAIRQFSADRVLLGTRSRSKLGKLLLGSVAEQVLRSVNIPVITVGPEAHLPVDSGEEQVVLLATTLRETSRPSAALACEIAADRKAKLILLHILPPVDEMERKDTPTGLDSLAMQDLRKLADETSKGCSCEIEPVVVHGNPSIEILAEASSRHASLIVLGATQRSSLGNLARDRTVYRVLAHARCPVLTLREPKNHAVESDDKPTAALHR